MKLTKEEKIKRKQEASYRRKGKRILKDKEYYLIANRNDRCSISFGRHISSGRYFMCEMGYSGCESRGYCNGDC